MSLTISEFFKLTKPGVLYLLMITAGASMILATNFNLDIIKALTGFLGIAFIAGSSAAINQILDFKALMISKLKLVAKIMEAPAVIINRYRTPGFVSLKNSEIVRLMRGLL